MTASPSAGPTQAALSATPTQFANDTAAPTREIAAETDSGMPSTMMLGSTAGILIAFAVSVGFLLRERRLHRQELEERELEHWTSYR